MDRKVFLENIMKNFHQIVMPSSLWGAHIDPNFKFVAILHVAIGNSLQVNIDKGLLITSDKLDEAVNTSFYIHNRVVNMHILNFSVQTPRDISDLLQSFDELNVCENATKLNEFVDCIMYTENRSSYCMNCQKDNIDLFEDSNVECVLLSQDCNLSSYSNVEYSNAISHETSKDNCDVVETCKDDTQNKDIRCEFCQKTFQSKRQLSEHSQAHSNQTPYVCNICNKLSSQRSTHQKHLRTHSNYKPNLCNICGKTFCQGYRMEDHMLTHTSIKRYECYICQKRFAKKYNLKQHESTHTGDRSFICSTCGKTYTTSSNLSTHIKSTHSDKKPHKCGVCQMSFVHPYMLKLHMRKHTGEKPFRCTVCAKTFAKNIHLKVHTRIHTGEKPHVCEDCGRGFTTTGNLTAHKRTHVKKSS